MANNFCLLCSVPKFIPIPYQFYQDIQNKSNHIQCVNTKTRPEYRICIHNKTADRFISVGLEKYGIWEGVIGKKIKELLQKYRGATFIDLGAHIGAHALYAAAMGSPVVAVEPNPENLPNLHKAVLLNKFTGNFTLLPYAISSDRTQLQMVKRSDNLGASFIRRLRVDNNSLEIGNVSSILLNDLIHFIRTNISILKIDIETHECRIFVKPGTYELLFRHTFIPYIFMEWGFQNLADRNCVNTMVEVITALGYVPKTLGGANLPIVMGSEELPENWPMDIAWEHQSQAPISNYHQVSKRLA